jgi:Tol biopolymer transport system component
MPSRERNHARARMALRLLSVVGLLAGALYVAGPAHATFPGKNGLIVLGGLHGDQPQIFTLHPDGSHLRQLTHVSTGAVDTPHWSPDGRRIAYCVASEGCEAQFGSLDSRIWVMKRDGSNQHQITDDPAFYDVDPSWSPDGHHILFSRCSIIYGTCDIDVMRADGTHIHKLIAGHWHHSRPTYSPDGTKIAFASDKGGYVTRVWVANRDGSELRAITPPKLEGDRPTWAPDGSRILFAAHVRSDNSNVWSVAPDGTHLHLLTRFPSFVATYAPNGRTILASDLNLSVCGCQGLVLLNLDGTIQRRVITSRQFPGVGVEIDWAVAP